MADLIAIGYDDTTTAEQALEKAEELAQDLIIQQIRTMGFSTDWSRDSWTFWWLCWITPLSTRKSPASSKPKLYLLHSRYRTPSTTV